MYLVKEPLRLKNYKISISRPVPLRNIVVSSFTTITTFPWGFATYVSSWLGGCVLSESGIRLADILIDSIAC